MVHYEQPCTLNSVCNRAQPTYAGDLQDLVLTPCRCAPKQRTDSGQQFGVVKRLGDEVIRAPLKSPHAVDFVSPRREHDDRYLRIEAHEQWICIAHLATQVETAAIGEPDIEQHDVWPVRVDFGARMRDGSRHVHDEVVGRKVLGQKAEDARLIIDDEYDRSIGRHWKAMLLCCCSWALPHRMPLNTPPAQIAYRTFCKQNA